MKPHLLVSAICFGSVAVIGSANALTIFDNGNITSSMAATSGNGTEAGDDFVLTTQTLITGATFTGLLPLNASLGSIANIEAEIYRVFPLDSTNPPSGNVPTRVNSPSDVAFDSRSSSGGTLTFTSSILSASFSAANSVQPGGMNSPNQPTGGDGAVTGQEVQFTVTFASPFNLSSGHYFFVPNVDLIPNAGDFLWLSSVRPIVPPGTPFFPDLQAWIRDNALEPDWLRIGTDIVGGTPAPTFNLAFSLEGAATPLPGALPLFATGLGALGLLGWRRKRKAI
jgi:hypothetical protein